MKIIFLILFPFLLQAQNVWFVDRDTPQKDNPSGQNGRSWATAWQDLDSVGYWTDYCGVNWNIIQAGDTIYISGGTDSTTYTPEDHSQGVCIYGMTMVYSGNYSFAGGDPVVIAPAWHPNHNGDVYFVTRDDTIRQGTASGTQTNRLIDASANFTANHIGLRVWNVDSLKNSYATIDSIETTTRARLTGHIIQSGEDYLIVNPQQRALDIAGISNVKFVNLNFYNLSTPYFSSSNVVSLGDASNNSNPDSLIQFEYCNFYTRGSNAQIGMGSTKTTVRYCSFDMEESDFINDNDAMGFSGGLGGHIIDNNTFRFRNGDMVGGAHRDCLQWSNVGQSADTVTRYATHISNNLIVDLEPQGIGWNAYVYSSGMYANQTFYIYNNIFVNKKEYSNPNSIFMYHPETSEFNKWDQSYHILNNTFIMKGTGSGHVTTLWSDTTNVYNNIMVVDTINTLFYSLDGADGYPTAIKNIDYNLYAERYGITADAFGFENGNNRTFDYWQSSLSYDVNSDTMDARDLIFTNKYGTTKADYYTTFGNGQGVNLWNEYPFLRTDALGNARPQNGAWDIGALQYDSVVVVDSTPSNVVFATDVSNAELNTQYTGNIYELADFDSGYIHVDRGWYNIDGGAWKDASEWTMVYPTDDIAVRDTSAATYSTSKSIVVTIGNASDTWTLTTKDSSITNYSPAIGSNGAVWFSSDNEPIYLRPAAYVPPVGEPDTTAPSAPTNLIAIGGTYTDRFVVNWVDPNAIDLDSIRYYEGSSDDTLTMVWIASIVAGAETYLRTGRTSNTTYYCAVKAVDDSGNISYFSNVDSATTSSTENGQPLQNLKMAYLSQSTAGHLYDHSFYGNAGTTTMPDEMAAYNTANGLTGYNAGSITKMANDYPDCGDMIWHWHEVFYGGTDHGNTNPTEYIVDDWLIDTTYSIFQITFGFACGALDYYGWYSDASDTANYPTSLIGNNFKYYTRQMIYVMEQYPEKYFVLWTLFPVGTDYSDSVGLRRASEFGKWMTDTLAMGIDTYGDFPNNIMIFDVRTLLDSSYYLPDSYADSPIDPHPNAAAASYIAPIYIQQVFDKARAYRRP